VSCPHCRGAESLFDERVAERDLRRLRKRGPARTTRILLDALVSDGVGGSSVLDIGGGVGAIPGTLLKAGAKQAVAVDASAAYIRAAKSEAERQGLGELVTYHYGDFVELAPEIAPADVVTLDRVVCCYNDMEALVGTSAERAERLYGLVYPRDTWWNRLGVSLVNIALRVFRSPFRVFIHSPRDVERVIAEKGLERRFHRRTVIWQVVVYERRQGLTKAA
jgi:SAM-dependent methyltransferase